jgi:hypothetical protein
MKLDLILKNAKKANSLTTTPYTSAAGNSYLSNIFTDSQLAIKEDVGHGYLHKFLNKIEIYLIKDNTLICDKTYHSFIYNKFSVIDEIYSLLVTVLKQAAKNKGIQIAQNELEKAKQQIKQVAQNLYNIKNNSPKLIL